MLKALVTGGAGLVGGAVISALLNKGYEVTATCNNHAPDSAFPGEVNWVKADLTKEIPPGINASDMHVIVHCAAVFPSHDHTDEQSYIINKAIDDNVIGFCKKNVQTRFVYISTVYLEQVQIVPGTYYAGKLEGEAMVAGMNNPSAIFRISSPYGPGQRTNNVLNLFMQKALQGAHLTYYGSGSRTQDFIAAADIANAVICYLDNSVEKCMLNICSSDPVSMKDLATMVKKVSGNDAVHVLSADKEDPQEQYRAIFDNSEATRLLGWKPVVYLEDGIKDCVVYLRSRV